MDMNKIFEKDAALNAAAHEELNTYAEDPEQMHEDPPMPAIKQTSITVENTLVVISPVGRLDTVTSAELKAQIAQYDVSGKDIELDFANVDYISSAGLRLLVTLQKQAKSGGNNMTIRNINAVVKEVFRISGFNKAFTVL